MELARRWVICQNMDDSDDAPNAKMNQPAPGNTKIPAACVWMLGSTR